MVKHSCHGICQSLVQNGKRASCLDTAGGARVKHIWAALGCYLRALKVGKQGLQQVSDQGWPAQGVLEAPVMGHLEHACWVVLVMPSLKHARSLHVGRASLHMGMQT